MKTLPQSTADLQLLHFLRDYCEKLVERYATVGKLQEQIPGCSLDEAKDIAAKMRKAAIKKRDMFNDQITFYERQQ